MCPLERIILCVCVCVFGFACSDSLRARDLASDVLPTEKAESEAAIWDDDDDVYYYIRWRLKLEGETD